MRKLFIVFFALMTLVVSACGNSPNVNWFIHYEDENLGGLNYAMETAPDFVFGNPSRIVLHSPIVTDGSDRNPTTGKIILDTAEFEFSESTMFVVGNNPADNTANIGDFDWAVTITYPHGFQEVVYSENMPTWLWQDESHENNVLVITGAKVFWVAVSNDRTQEFQAPYSTYEEYYVHAGNPDSISIDNKRAPDWGLCLSEINPNMWGPCK